MYKALDLIISTGKGEGRQECSSQMDGTGQRVGLC